MNGISTKLDNGLIVLNLQLMKATKFSKQELLVFSRIECDMVTHGRNSKQPFFESIDIFDAYDA